MTLDTDTLMLGGIVLSTLVVIALLVSLWRGFRVRQALQTEEQRPPETEVGQHGQASKPNLVEESTGEDAKPDASGSEPSPPPHQPQKREEGAVVQPEPAPEIRAATTATLAPVVASEDIPEPISPPAPSPPPTVPVAEPRPTTPEPAEAAEVEIAGGLETVDAAAATPDTAGEDLGKASFFSRLRRGLGRTSDNLVQGLGNLFLGRKEIDAELLEELESRLLLADVGVDATLEIIDHLTQRVSRKELTRPEALQAALQDEVLTLLTPCEQPLEVQGHQP